MKKIFLVSAAVIFSNATSFGQGLGLRAGYNYSSTQLSTDRSQYIDFVEDLNDVKKYTSGFFVGVNYEFPLSNVFYLEPGLNFTTKGYRTDLSDLDDPYYYQSKTNLYYLDVPILFKTKMNIGKVKLYAGVGPYFGFGLFGNTSFDGENKEGWDFDDRGLQSFDFGLIFATGVEFGKFDAGVSYDLGLVNMYDTNIFKQKNRTMSVCVGYRFGSGKK